MRGLLLVCVSFLSFAPRVPAQEQFKLTGSVVNAVSGEPIRSAMVVIAGQESRTVMAGPDGRFELNLLAGMLWISAQRAGFAMNIQPRQVILNSATQSVVIKLNPLSKISGRIIDREGEPIEGITVHCMQEVIVMGRKQWQSPGVAATDELGRFSIEDLPAAVYVLSTDTTPLYPGTNPKAEAARYVYPESFYPNAENRDSAERITLAPGVDMKVDMSLHTIRAARVSFSTVPPYRYVMGQLAKSAGQVDPNMSQIAPLAEVLILNAVTPGSWKLTARGPFGPDAKPNQAPMYGELPLEVGTADVENLKVPLNRLPDIQVLVTGGPAAGIYVSLNSNGYPTSGSQVDRNGSLNIRTVLPGNYHVNVQPDSTCIAALLSGSQDLLHDELVVPPGVSIPPIQLTLGTACPQLTITSNSQRQLWSVVTSSSNKGFEPRMSGLPAGGATLTGLPEGEYNVYLFDDLANLEFANPEAMRGFKSKSITLEAGKKASVQPEVNERVRSSQ